MELKKFYSAVDYVMDRVRAMNVMDLGIFKICLISFGMLLGFYLAKSGRRLIPLIWVLFVLSFILLIFQLLIAPELDGEE